jgi:signal transduction histidine kinase/DNA-binding response OmpR family regulator
MYKWFIVAFLLLWSEANIAQKNQGKLDSLVRLIEAAKGENKLQYVEPLKIILPVNAAKPYLPLFRELEQLAVEQQDRYKLLQSWLLITRSYHSRFEFDSLRQVARQGIELAQQMGNDTLLGEFYNAMGISHEKVGILDSAEYYYLLALEKNPDIKMSVYNNLGLAYIRRSNFGKSIEYLEVALAEAEALGNINAQAVIANNIGMSHRYLDNIEKGKSYALRALELKRQLGDERGMLFPLVQLINLNMPLEEHKAYIDTALTLARKVEDPVFERLFTAKSAEVSIWEGRLQQALNKLQPIYEQSKEAQSYDQSEIMRILSEAYFALKRYPEAERVARELLELGAAKNVNDEMQNARSLLMRIYAAQAKYQAAFEIGTEYYEHRDSQQRQLNLDQLAALDAQLEDVEREKEIAALNSELKQKDIRRKWMIAVGALLVLISILLIYFRGRRIKAQKAMIEQEQQAARQLGAMNEKLKGLDQMKNRLFTNITHEFRTPLTVILGMAEQLESSDERDKSADLRKLALIRRNGKSLLDLINQMLDLSKIEDNKLKVNFVQGDIIPYTKYITESFHSMANAQNILLKVNPKVPEIVMDYDPEKIRQMLSNLLSNAIKYTPSGGKVSVTVDQLQTPIPQLYLSVKDNGAGIPAEELPHIFDRFYQSSDTIAQSGGTGIGLALTKELIKLLDGSIEVESKLGEGTTFTITLPITQQAAPAASPRKETATPVQASYLSADALAPVQKPDGTATQDKPSLLIVEDNPDVVEYLSDCLQDTYKLDFAYNGRVGIEQAVDQVPDIIISDVMMPEKNGFELCDALKNDERTSHIPIVLLTARADVESRISGLRRGADAYLAKPFHRGELLAVLGQLVELRAKLRSRYVNLSAEAPQEQEVAEEEFVIEDAFIQKARLVVLEHLENATFGVQDFSQALGMSYPVVHRKLSALTGRSPSLFVRAIRLGEAKKLLENTDLNVSEIAYDCGFNDPKFFSRVFSKEFGQSPSKFRAAL